MRIAIDARTLTETPVTGIGKHLHGLLAALRARETGHEWFLYSNRPLAPELTSAPGWHARTRSGRWLANRGAFWLDRHARPMAVEDRADLFWGPCFLVPHKLPPGMKALVSLHDLVYPLHAGTMKLGLRLTMSVFFAASTRRADHVLALSETTAADLAKHLAVATERITVVLPGVAPAFAPREKDAASPYLLAVGTLEPRKNLAALIRAFLALPEADRRRWPLRIAGSSGWKSSDLATIAEPGVREGTIRFLGYVPDAELPGLYAGATLLASPSLYEGFGIPVIEAMASGTPVLLSDIPVYHEVAGEAARFVAPADPAAWTRELGALLHDPGALESLRALGLARARRFRFEDSATRLLAVLELLAAQGPRK